jgi:glutaredoxin
MVRLYGYSDCPYCVELKELFDTNKLEYKYIDVTLKENERECDKIFKIVGEEVVPIVIVEKKLLVPNKSFRTISEAFDITKKLLKE